MKIFNMFLYVLQSFNLALFWGVVSLIILLAVIYGVVLAVWRGEKVRTGGDKNGG
ncbi:MAG: hypothetical protein WC340_15655 [Kiritimatiellia bacterium]